MTCLHCETNIEIHPAFDREEIIKKAWALYYSPEKMEIEGYTKYEALSEVV